MHGGRFEINQLLFADDTALFPKSKEKLCRLMSELVECDKRKLRVNVGKSKVMRCSKYRKWIVVSIRVTSGSWWRM